MHFRYNIVFYQVFIVQHIFCFMQNYDRLITLFLGILFCLLYQILKHIKMKSFLIKNLKKLTIWLESEKKPNNQKTVTLTRSFKGTSDNNDYFVAENLLLRDAKHFIKIVNVDPNQHIHELRLTIISNE